MARVVRLTAPFYSAIRRLALRPATKPMQAIAKVLATLGEEPLPAFVDVDVPLPPVGRVWVRRIGRLNLWLWFTFDDHAVRVRTLTNQPPPIPLEYEGE